LLTSGFSGPIIWNTDSHISYKGAFVKKVVPLILILLSFAATAFAQDKVTIWGWRAQDADMWTKVQSALQAKGTNVAIEYKTFLPTEYDSKLFVSLQGGSGPDIMYTRRLPSASRTQALIDGKYIVPMDGKVDLKKIPDTTLGFIRQDGKTWGVPFANQVVGIFYNAEIFAKYNLKEPATWDELLKICETLQKNGVTPFYVTSKDAWTNAMQNAMVGVSYPGEAWIAKLIAGKVKFTDPEYVGMLTALKDLTKYYQDGFVANTSAEQDVAFSMGQAGMIFYGIWGNTNWLKTNPDFKFGFFPVPAKDKSVQPRVYVYMDGSYGLYSGSKVQAAALKVLNFAATPEFGKIFSETTGEITAVSGVAMPKDKPVVQECYDASTKIASASRYWVGSPFDAGKPSVYDLMTENMQAMYAGALTPVEVAKKMQDGIELWYPAFKK
jgi:raffinose/stachyose/melibiose transport system substrate-binding protein